MDDVKRLKKKYNKLLASHRKFKLAVLEYAVMQNDQELIDLLRKQ